MGKDLIVKDNKLIRAKYTLNVYQTRFVAHMASMINREDKDFFTYKISLNELLKILKIERRHWKRLDRTLLVLMGKVIVIEDLDMAYKELKEKGDYFFEYEPIKVRKKVQILKFRIFKNGEKIKKDFSEKKKLLLQNSTTKVLAQEQIRRVIERQDNKIKDKLKYEQKLFQLYLKGELKFDKDIQGIIDNMG